MRLPQLQRSLTAKLLAAQLAVIVAGAATLALVALLLGPTLFHRHIREALGYVPPTVLHHLDQAFGESLAVSLGLGVAAAAATAAVIAWLISKRIVRPVHALAGAARRVSRGDYEARVNIGGSDELTVLARAFNEMAATLGSAEARRQRLLADVAHELRTPLATVDAYLEGLADGVVEPGPDTWQLLRRESARMKRLSEDIARVSRAEEHQLELHLKHVQPHQLIETAALAAAPAFTDKNVELHVEPDPSTPLVAVDPERIAEVLANLLENALRHTPAGGSVTLCATRDDDSALLTVTDTGDGLEPRELERVFERFYRTDSARSRDRGGSGIGLTISRALVEAHGGQLWAESSGPGEGARFLLRLPNS
jgi:two-component system, OmpR family, sensor histidine kinase BaeS